MSTRVLTLRRPGRCASCGDDLRPGSRGAWDVDARTVTCLDCAGIQTLEASPPAPPEASTRGAGGSAQREHDRRRDARRERVLSNHPRVGRLLLALVDDPSSTKVWAPGAAGERAIAERLDNVESALMLHDRRLRRPDGRLSQANIDHIAVTPSGVWVIDAKTHKGRLEVRRSGRLLSPRVAELRINGRDQSKLVEGVQRQLHAVRAALRDGGFDVPTAGGLCFYGTELPSIDEDVDGIALRGRRGMTKLLRRPGALGHEVVAEVHHHLDTAFPPA